MKKTLLCLVTSLLFSLSLEATPVSRQQAQAIARNFLMERGAQVGQIRATHKSMAKAKADGSQPYYVFNNGANDGFVIVAGDDRAPQVLGYSLTGNFGEEDVPQNVSAWLDEYAAQIEDLADGRPAVRRVSQGTELARISISPLVMSHWNQYAPYFNSTPKVGTRQCLTGCVATAFAQVMKYHEWPKSETTVVPGYEWNGSTLADLPATKFDWANMLYDYQGGGNASAGCNDPDINQEAVARLMVYCGYAVQASYGTGSTGAPTAQIPDAMKNYFGYKGNISYVSRSNYSTADWEALIYNEIYNGRPVIYSGNTPSGGGHAFICDGYGEDGYYHINWGWGGMSDGYYLLSILEPGEQGAGGSNDGYSHSQGAVIGIQPGASDEAAVTGPCLKILDFILKDYDATDIATHGPSWFGVGFDLQGLMDGNHQLNAQLLQDGVVKYEGTPIEQDLNKGYYWGRIITRRFFTNQTLADGTYEVRLVCRMVEDGKEYEWVPCLESEKYKNEVTISGNTVTYSNAKLSPQITCRSFSTPFVIYVNNITNGVATLINQGSINYQDKVYLWVNGNLEVSDMAYIDAGETIDMSFAFTPTTTGANSVKITTDASGSDIIYEGSINVSEVDASAAYNLELTAWKIDNLDTESGKICGGTVSGTMTVTNTGNYTYSGDIAIGYIGGGFIGWSPRNHTLAAGESVELEYTVDNATLGSNYRLVCWEGENRDKEIGKTPSYELVAGGYTYWTADGTSKTKAVSTDAITIVDNALAVKFFTNPTGSVTPNSNPNTLYYVSGTVPSGLDGKNVVVNGQTDHIAFSDGYSFYVPAAFTAAQATYSRVPRLGANGSSGWETIVLPFAAQKAFNQTDGKQIYWFVDRNDDGKDFWLKSFAYTDGEAAYFDFVKDIRANVPYIIATPGDKWGSQYDLRNKTIAFTAEKVSIPQTSKLKAMTSTFDFVGLCESQHVSGYVLDETGRYFDLQDNVSLDAFRAYFSVDAGSPAAYAPRLRIGTSDVDAITETTSLTDGEATVYSLNGMKVGTVKISHGRADIGHLPSGVYIINGKKLMK